MDHNTDTSKKKKKKKKEKKRKEKKIELETEYYQASLEYAYLKGMAEVLNHDNLQNALHKFQQFLSTKFIPKQSRHPYSNIYYSQLLRHGSLWVRNGCCTELSGRLFTQLDLHLSN